jgi:hypothetical protein
MPRPIDTLFATLHVLDRLIGPILIVLFIWGYFHFTRQQEAWHIQEMQLIVEQSDHPYMLPVGATIPSAMHRNDLIKLVGIRDAQLAEKDREIADLRMKVATKETP